MINLNELADDIVKGKRFGRTDDLSFFKTCDISELTKAADKIRAHFKGAACEPYALFYVLYNLFTHALTTCPGVFAFKM